MNKTLCILRYEYGMQMKRAAAWGVLIAACAIALMDNLPTATNLARLEFLAEPAYFLRRTMSLDGLILVFGLMFLLAGRFPLDKKTGVQPLLMAAPLAKGQYVWGKLVAGFLFTFTMLSLFLCINLAAYLAAASFAVSLGEAFASLIKTVVVCGLPVSFFVGFVSVALPAVMDVRLFYLLASALFFFNAASVGSAEEMPFYLITSGDLIKLIWRHPKWPFINTGSVRANLLFLLGCGLSALLLLCKPGFWRER